MSQSNAARLKCLIAPSSFDRLAVFIALPVPAQHISTLSWPCAARASANPASTLSSEVTLTSQNTPPISAATLRPFSAWRSNIATLAPFAASARALASPRPDAPPVTIAAVCFPNSIPHSRFEVLTIVGAGSSCRILSVAIARRVTAARARTAMAPSADGGPHSRRWPENPSS